MEGGVSEFARAICTVWGSVCGLAACLFERPCRSGCVRSSSLGKGGSTPMVQYNTYILNDPYEPQFRSVSLYVSLTVSKIRTFSEKMQNRKFWQIVKCSQSMVTYIL